MGSSQGGRPLNILILGAGVSGLSTALFLQRSNPAHTITVLERTTDIQSLGGPINLSPPATRELITCGLRERIEKSLEPCRTKTEFRDSQGSCLGTIPIENLEKLIGSPLWTGSRFGYQKVFLEVARERGVKVLYGHRVARVLVDKTAVVLSDGQELSADLIIGADGIGSIARSAVLADDPPLSRVSPVTALNIDVPRALLSEDPDLKPLMEENQNFWTGPGHTCAGAYVRDLKRWNGCFVMEDTTPKKVDGQVESASDSKSAQQGDWFARGSKETLLEHYGDWDPRLVKLIKLAKEEDIYVWNITDLPILPRWWKNRTVLIGDAAHAMLPFLGMGATSSIEDGAALCTIISRAQSADDLPKLLAAYEAIRRPRGECLARLSRENMANWHTSPGPLMEKRNAAWADFEAIYNTMNKAWDGTHVDEPVANTFDPLVQAYIRAHRPVEFANRKLDEIVQKS